jgi:hypothetical protein
MNSYPLSRFGPSALGFIAMGQGQDPAALQDLRGRVFDAISRYQALVARAALIKDDVARKSILDWIGNGSVPGTPSERFRFVQEDLSANAPWDEIRTGHLDDLEAVNSELETRVANGEKSGSYSPSGVLSLVDAQGKLTGTGVGLVALGILALIVVPLTIK